MPKNQINSSFENLGMVKKPTTPNAGTQTNPGVCEALNTPPTEGVVKTAWYQNIRQAPSVGTTIVEKMDSSFRGRLDMSFNPPGVSGARDPNPVDSSFEAVNLVKSLGPGSTAGEKANFTPPSSNMNPGIGSGENTSGGGSSNPMKRY